MQIRPLKQFGQHFLTDSSITDRMVEAASVCSEDRVWEIGPGEGILTRSILERNPHLCIFELDRRLTDHLNESFGTKANVIMQDILRVDWQKEIECAVPGKIKLISNIPYQITSPLLYRIASFAGHFEKIVIMVQKEFAQRLTAKPSTKQYGVLTLKIRLNFDVQLLEYVSRECFSPPPKVDSAIIMLSPREFKPDIKELDIYHQIIQKAFEHRRKTLRNNLSSMFEKQTLEKIENETGIDFSRRGETLSEAEFILLSDAVARRL